MLRKVLVGLGVMSLFAMMMLESPVIAAPTDPCALLTTAQASAALGGTVTGGEPLAGQGCMWELLGKNKDVLMKLTINVVTADRYTRMKSVTASTITGVNGLGDDAFYATLKLPTESATTLNIKKGDRALIIHVFGSKRPVEEYQAKEKAVAQTVVPKL